MQNGRRMNVSEMDVYSALKGANFPKEQVPIPSPPLRAFTAY